MVWASPSLPGPAFALTTVRAGQSFGRVAVPRVEGRYIAGREPASAGGERRFIGCALEPKP